MITQKELKTLLNYDPETGLFHWLVKPSIAVKIGDRAGSVLNKKPKPSYIAIKVKGKRYLAHKLAWLYCNGELPETIDHINGSTIDNRISNLRSVSQAENAKNLKKYKNNTTGIPGVHWHKSQSRWQSSIGVNGKLIYLGSFTDIDCAIEARKEAEVKYGFHQNHGKR